MGWGCESVYLMAVLDLEMLDSEASGHTLEALGTKSNHHL